MKQSSGLPPEAEVAKAQDGDGEETPLPTHVGWFCGFVPIYMHDPSGTMWGRGYFSDLLIPVTAWAWNTFCFTVSLFSDQWGNPGFPILVKEIVGDAAKAGEAKA